MIFNFFVSPEHEAFFADHFNDCDPQKSIFYYVVGASAELRRRFSSFFDAEQNKLIDDGLEAIPAKHAEEYALLAIAFEIFNKDHICSCFVDSFLRLDPHRQRVVLEALAQLGGTADE